MKCIKRLDHIKGEYDKPICVSDQEAFNKVEKGWTRKESWDYCPKHEWKSATRPDQGSMYELVREQPPL